MVGNQAMLTGKPTTIPRLLQTFPQTPREGANMNWTHSYSIGQGLLGHCATLAPKLTGPRRLQIQHTYKTSDKKYTYTSRVHIQISIQF